MSAALISLLARLPMSPTPTPTPTSPLDELSPSEQAAPGVWAFVAFLFLAICLWLLMRNMNARLRRMSYRQKAAEQASAARSPQDAQSAGSGSVAAEGDGRGDEVGDERQDR